MAGLVDIGADKIVDGLFSAGKELIDRLWPDPATKAKAILDLETMHQNGELAHLAAETDLLKGQLEINKVEAGSSSLFVSGWRPFIGWVCGGGVAFQIIFAPLCEWGAELLGYSIKFPPLDTATLSTVLLGMLGLGTMRTVEKVKGVSLNEPGH